MLPGRCRQRSPSSRIANRYSTNRSLWPNKPGNLWFGVGEVAVMSRAACAPCGDPHECQSDVRYCCLEDEVDYNELESAWAQLHGGR